MQNSFTKVAEKPINKTQTKDIISVSFSPGLKKLFFSLYFKIVYSYCSNFKSKETNYILLLKSSHRPNRLLGR